MPMMTEDASFPEPPMSHRYDLSLMLGGPLYQLYRRTRLSDDALHLLHRRIAVIALIAWLPLLVLSALEGLALGGVKVPFLYDIEMHVRLLVALPLLIVAEVVVHQRMPIVVRQFVTLGVVRDAARGKFDAAIDSALRLRNSIAAELLLLVFVYVVGVGVIWRHNVALPVATWYAQPVGGATHVTLAGWWNMLVSLPIFQFLLFRWYFRLFVWARFLWQVSRMDLHLAPLHPDRAAGLGFLTGFPKAFAPLLLAHGALLAGMFADGIFFAGKTLPEFKLELFAVVAVSVFLVVGPLLVFVPLLARVRRQGVREYGALAHTYVDEFTAKWLEGKRPADEPLVGSGDIQSLADLGNSFQVVEDMQVVPVSRRTLLYLAMVTALPVAPLSLTMISLDELVGRLAKLVF
jgi:hypothetical protein